MEGYIEKFEISKHIRDGQYRQLVDYLADQLETANSERSVFFAPDCESIDIYIRSIEYYRKCFLDIIGYPPPHQATHLPPREEYVGEDELCRIYRIYIPVAENLECYGLYMVPKTISGKALKAPLMLSLHGGNGCPELLCNFVDSMNYNDASRRFLKEGFIVFSPLFTFWPYVDRDCTDIPKDVRSILDLRAKWIGSSLMSIEIFKVIKALDYLLAREEINSSDVGISGLSYGGFYAMLITAIDNRIHYCVSSCAFNDRVLVNQMHPGELFDWTWKGNIGKIADAEIIGMICPRPCIIEMGIKDYYVPIEGARTEYSRAKKHYDKLEIGERFTYLEFDGTHEYNLTEAIPQVMKIRNKNWMQQKKE